MQSIAGALHAGCARGLSPRICCISWLSHHPLAKEVCHVLSCLPPISHVPSPCSSSFSLSFPFSFSAWGGSCPLELCVWSTAVSLTCFRTASDSVWEVNSQWHVQYVAQMFLPPPALSHAICSIADKGYGLEIWGRQSNGWEMKGRLILILLSWSYASVSSIWELGMGEERWCVWRWIYSISEEDFLEWMLYFLPKTALHLFFGHYPCLGSRKRNSVLPSSLF